MIRRLDGATKGQIEVLEAKAAQLTAEGFAVSRTQAQELVSIISKQLRQVHYWETVVWACGAAVALGGLSWFGGWQLRGMADRQSLWGDIERWNQPELQACIEAERTTCNFHIEVPDHPVKQ